MKKTSKTRRSSSKKKIEIPTTRRVSSRRSSDKRKKEHGIKINSKKVAETVKEVQTDIFHAKNRQEVASALEKLPPALVLEEVPNVQKASKEFLKRTSSHKSTKKEQQIQEILSSDASPEEMLEQIQMVSGKKPSPDTKRWIIRMIDMTRKLGKSAVELTPYVIGLLATGAAGYFGFYYAIPYLASLMPSLETLQILKTTFFGYGPILPPGMYGSSISSLIGAPLSDSSQGTQIPTNVTSSNPPGKLATPFQQAARKDYMTYLRDASISPILSESGSDLIHSTYPIVLSRQGLAGLKTMLNPNEEAQLKKEAVSFFKKNGLTSDKAVEQYVNTHQPGGIKYHKSDWQLFKQYWFFVQRDTFGDVNKALGMF